MRWGARSRYKWRDDGQPRPAQSTDAIRSSIRPEHGPEFSHILIDFSKSILITSCAAMYHLGLSKKEDTKLDECTAILTRTIELLLSAHVLVQVSWQYEFKRWTNHSKLYRVVMRKILTFSWIFKLITFSSRVLFCVTICDVLCSLTLWIMDFTIVVFF